MGWTALSERELQRIQVLSEVMSRARTVASASVVLALSTRQVHRLLKVYRSGGAGSLAHKGRGRPSNNRIQEDVRHRAMARVRTHYPDFGPTLVAEMLALRHELKVSRETLRGWMTEAGLWLSRKRGAMHAAGLHRRCQRPTDAAALRDLGECLRLLRGPAGLSRGAWLPGRLLLRQALGVPRRPQGGQGRPGHDSVRPGVGYGVNVFPTQIEEQILKCAGLAPHFQIELTRAGRMDNMTVHVEATAQAGDAAARAASAKELAHHIKSVVGVSSKIEVHDPNGIERSEGKAKRVVDNRPKQ